MPRFSSLSGSLYAFLLLALFVPPYAVRADAPTQPPASTPNDPNNPDDPNNPNNPNDPNAPDAITADSTIPVATTDTSGPINDGAAAGIGLGAVAALGAAAFAGKKMYSSYKEKKAIKAEARALLTPQKEEDPIKPAATSSHETPADDAKSASPRKPSVFGISGKDPNVNPTKAAAARAELASQQGKVAESLIKVKKLEHAGDEGALAEAQAELQSNHAQLEQAQSKVKQIHAETAKSNAEFIAQTHAAFLANAQAAPQQTVTGSSRTQRAKALLKKLNPFKKSPQQPTEPSGASKRSLFSRTSSTRFSFRKSAPVQAQTHIGEREPERKLAEPDLVEAAPDKTTAAPTRKAPAKETEGGASATLQATPDSSHRMDDDAASAAEPSAAASATPTKTSHDKKLASAQANLDKISERVTQQSDLTQALEKLHQPTGVPQDEEAHARLTQELAKVNAQAGEHADPELTKLGNARAKLEAQGEALKQKHATAKATAESLKDAVEKAAETAKGFQESDTSDAAVTARRQLNELKAKQTTADHDAHALANDLEAHKKERSKLIGQQVAAAARVQTEHQAVLSRQALLTNQVAQLQQAQEREQAARSEQAGLEAQLEAEKKQNPKSPKVAQLEEQIRGKKAEVSAARDRNFLQKTLIDKPLSAKDRVVRFVQKFNPARSIQGAWTDTKTGARKAFNAVRGRLIGASKNEEESPSEPAKSESSASLRDRFTKAAKNLFKGKSKEEKEASTEKRGVMSRLFSSRRRSAQIAKLTAIPAARPEEPVVTHQNPMTKAAAQAKTGAPAKASASGEPQPSTMQHNPLMATSGKVSAGKASAVSKSATAQASPQASPQPSKLSGWFKKLTSKSEASSPKSTKPEKDPKTEKEGLMSRFISRLKKKSNALEGTPARPATAGASPDQEIKPRPGLGKIAGETDLTPINSKKTKASSSAPNSSPTMTNNPLLQQQNGQPSAAKKKSSVAAQQPSPQRGKQPHVQGATLFRPNPQKRAPLLRSPSASRSLVAHPKGKR